MKYSDQEINEVLQTHLFAPATQDVVEDKEATERLTAIAVRILDSGRKLNMAQAWKELRREGWRADKGRP